jgi:hypothetical protein
MLAQIRKQKGKISALLLIAGTSMLMLGCASQKDRVTLVNDPDAKPEGQMPWNKQEKWETGGQFANMTDHR